MSRWPPRGPMSWRLARPWDLGSLDRRTSHLLNVLMEEGLWTMARYIQIFLNISPTACSLILQKCCGQIARPTSAAEAPGCPAASNPVPGKPLIDFSDPPECCPTQLTSDCWGKICTSYLPGWNKTLHNNNTYKLLKDNFDTATLFFKRK